MLKNDKVSNNKIQNINNKGEGKAIEASAYNIVKINKLSKDKDGDKNKEINIIFKKIDEGLRVRRLNNLVLLAISRMFSLASKPLL